MAARTRSKAPAGPVTVQLRDPAWVAEQLADPASRAVVASLDAVLGRARDGRLARVPLDGLREPLLLGLQDGGALFAADARGATTWSAVRAIVPTARQDEGGLIAYVARGRC
jgi:hypothetical protein